jgi:hypothetical protein
LRDRLRAAIAALTAKAKLAGERSEQTTKAGDLNQYSDSELAAIVRAGQLDTPLKPLN